jgi:hypothetical protein
MARIPLVYTPPALRPRYGRAGDPAVYQSMHRGDQRRSSGGSFLAGANLHMKFDVDQYRGASPAELTVARASIGYARTRAGKLLQFPINAMRKTDLGVLVEVGKTNLLLRSQELGTSWPPFFASVTSDATLAPDDTLTADAIVEDGTTNPHGVDQTVSVATNVQYTVSGRFKADTRFWLRLRIDDGGGTNACQAWINIATGAVGTIQNTGTATLAAVRVVALQDGWYEVSLTGIPASVSTGLVRTLIRMTTGDAVSSHLGDGVSRIFVWGMQLETGVDATSYIPTTTVSANRGNDAITLGGSFFTALYTGGLAGTLFAKAIHQNSLTTDNNAMFGVDDGTVNNRITLRSPRSTNNAVGVVVTGGVVQSGSGAAVASGIFPVGVVGKMALAYANNDIQAAANGTLGSPIVSASTMPSILNQFVFGQPMGVTHLGGYLQEVAYFPFQVPDAALTGMTIL